MSNPNLNQVVAGTHRAHSIILTLTLWFTVIAIANVTPIILAAIAWIAIVLIAISWIAIVLIAIAWIAIALIAIALTAILPGVGIALIHVVAVITAINVVVTTVWDVVLSSDVTIFTFCNSFGLGYAGVEGSDS